MYKRSPKRLTGWKIALATVLLTALAALHAAELAWHDLPVRTPGRLRVIMGGDVHFQWQIQQNLKEKSPAAAVAGVREVFSAADLRIINLETAVSVGVPPEPGRSHAFNAPPEALKALEELGVQAVVLANNHTMDLGAEGLAQTQKHLTAQRIKFAGAGKDTAAAASAVLFRAGKIRIALLSGTDVGDDRMWAADQRPGALRAALLPAVVAQVRPLVDHVIVGVHWGAEYDPYASAEQIALARQIVRSGASVVFGHHSHALQGVESGPGYVVAYSLGNLLFGSTNPYQNHNALLAVEFEEGKQGVRLASMIPLYGEYRKHGHVPQVLSKPDSMNLFPILRFQSRRISPDMQDRMSVMPDGTYSLKVD
jgi:hypothetical protein